MKDIYITALILGILCILLYMVFSSCNCGNGFSVGAIECGKIDQSIQIKISDTECIPSDCGCNVKCGLHGSCKQDESTKYLPECSCSGNYNPTTNCSDCSASFIYPDMECKCNIASDKPGINASYCGTWDSANQIDCCDHADNIKFCSVIEKDGGKHCFPNTCANKPNASSCTGKCSWCNGYTTPDGKTYDPVCIDKTASCNTACKNDKKGGKCTNKECCNNGSCTESNDIGTCNCKKGFTGPNCELVVIPKGAAIDTENPGQIFPCDAHTQSCLRGVCDPHTQFCLPSKDTSFTCGYLDADTNQADLLKPGTKFDKTYNSIEVNGNHTCPYGPTYCENGSNVEACKYSLCAPGTLCDTVNEEPETNLRNCSNKSCNWIGSSDRKSCNINESTISETDWCCKKG